jgi:diketogulonate reductase-like aldo/keto reductase
MNFGELTDEAASFSIMDEALDAGINFFDTADVYGGTQSPDMEKGRGGLAMGVSGQRAASSTEADGMPSGFSIQ